MLGGLTTFRPTANQKAAMSYMQECDYDCTITETCKAIGICRQSYYQWFRRPEFVKWWNEQQERHFVMAAGRVQAAVLKGAVTNDAPGSATDRKLFFDRLDKTRAGHDKKKADEAPGRTFEEELAALEAAEKEGTDFDEVKHHHGDADATRTTSDGHSPDRDPQLSRPSPCQSSHDWDFFVTSPRKPGGIGR
jgi:hypothetical protein